MSSKKPNLKNLYENQASRKSRGKNAFKESELSSNFDRQKEEFLKRKTRRYKAKKDDQNLPPALKNLLGKFADVLVNVSAADMEKYRFYREKDGKQ